jgi:hypothetical protein
MYCSSSSSVSNGWTTATSKSPSTKTTSGYSPSAPGASLTSARISSSAAFLLDAFPAHAPAIPPTKCIPYFTSSTTKCIVR